MGLGEQKCAKLCVAAAVGGQNLAVGLVHLFGIYNEQCKRLLYKKIDYTVCESIHAVYVLWLAFI